MSPTRHTKIVVTLGPSTDGPERIERLLAAGMDCVRINCSYEGPVEWARRVAEVRATERHRHMPVPVIFDLQGPKMRLVPETAEAQLAAGMEVRLTSEDNLPRAYEAPTLEVDHDGFVDLVAEGSEVVIGDGTPRLAAGPRDGKTVRATVVVPGRVGPGKGVTVINAHVDGATFTAKDEADLAAAVELDADFIAVSYVRTAKDVTDMHERLRAAGSRARVIAKIEQVEAYERLDEILAATDGVMVARGDLGVAVGSEQVPLIQKSIIRRATQAGKLVITATQMLESMIASPEPTRAEAADIANAVIDGTSAVMLSGETSTGAYPVEAVAKMAAIAAAAEVEDVRGAASDAFNEPRDEAVMHAALYLSFMSDAAALVAPTTSGGTARACAKYRPKRPIVAIADDAAVAAQLNLEWAVMATPYVDHPAAPDYIHAVLLQAQDLAQLPAGALVVVTAGPRAGQSGATNVIALHEIP